MTRAEKLVMIILIAATLAAAYAVAGELVRSSRRPATDVNYQWPPIEWRTRAA